MTNEDIIRMAKEAGLPRWYQTDEVVNMDLLGRFAALVATAEREACAKVADEFDPEMKMSNYGQVIANKIRAREDKYRG